MSLYPVYRTPAPGTVSSYPAELVRTMAPQIFNYRRIIGHHFARRHEDVRRYAAARNWIEAFRRDLQACGWNANAAYLNQGGLK